MEAITVHLWWIYAGPSPHNSALLVGSAILSECCHIISLLDNKSGGQGNKNPWEICGTKS